MNHKGQFEVARKTIYWMIIGFVIAIVVMGLALILGSFRATTTQIPEELPAQFIALRFTSLPECLAYVDLKAGLGNTGFIDLEKFTAEQLATCYRTEPQRGFKTYNFRLKLEGFGKEIITDNYFHQDNFELQ